MEVIFLLYALWLVDRDGLPITQVEFQQFQVNPILFSGFISAIYNFSVELGAGTVREVEMGTSKLIIYYYHQGVLLVMAVSKNDKSKKYEPLIQAIGDRVVTKYNLRTHSVSMRLIRLITKELWNIYNEFKEKELKYELAQIPILQNSKVQYMLRQMIHGNIVRLKPVIDKQKKPFVRYKIVEKILDLSPEDTQFILDELAAVGVLKKIPYLTTTLCPNCKGLNTYPVLKCPKCKYGTLVPEKLYEHFTCGYVGPKSQFLIEQDLFCPKCQKKLIKLGDDFREVEGYHCVDCNFVTLEPLDMLYCNECQTTYLPIEGIKHVVYAYALNSTIIDELNEFLLTQAITVSTQSSNQQLLKQKSSVQAQVSTAEAIPSTDKEFDKKSKFQLIKEIVKLREELAMLNQKIKNKKIIPKELLRRKKELANRLQKLEQWVNSTIV